LQTLTVNEDGEWKSHSQKKAYRRQDKKFLNWKSLLKAKPIDMTETLVEEYLPQHEYKN